MEWLNAVLQGILLGGLYALLAAGLSLMFGVMRIVNLAHGALAILAAYLGVVLSQNFGIPAFATLIVILPVMFGLGWVLQMTLLNKSLVRGGLAPILVTFGLAVVLIQLFQEIFSADFKSIQAGSIATNSIVINDQIAIGVFPLLTFVVGVAVIVALQLFLSRTRSGRAMRATSDDKDAAQLMGIDNRRIYALATAIALTTVGLAGVFLGIRTQFNPTYGDVTLVFAFEAVIIGGLGSLWGTLVGGMVLGIAQTLGSQINPAYGILIGHLVFLAILVFRPTGLLPKAVNS
jgi:branched-chain amino acid transport system permease protein